MSTIMDRSAIKLWSKKEPPSDVKQKAGESLLSTRVLRADIEAIERVKKLLETRKADKANK